MGLLPLPLSRLHNLAHSAVIRGRAKEYVKKRHAEAAPDAQASELPSDVRTVDFWNRLLTATVVGLWRYVALPLLDTRLGLLLVQYWLAFSSVPRDGDDGEEVRGAYAIDETAAVFVQQNTLLNLLSKARRHSIQIRNYTIACLTTLAVVLLLWVLMRDIAVRGRNALLVRLFGETSDGELIMLRGESDRALMFSADERDWLQSGPAIAVPLSMLADERESMHVPLFENNGEKISLANLRGDMQAGLEQSGLPCLTAAQIGVPLNVTLLRPREWSLKESMLGCPEMIVNARPLLESKTPHRVALFSKEDGAMLEPWKSAMSEVSTEPLAVEFEMVSYITRSKMQKTQCVVFEETRAQCLRFLWGGGAE